MKKLFAVIKWLLVAACFSSCCVFPYYINEENIMCKKPETIKSVDNEFCLLIGGTPSFKTHCMLYQLYDTSEAIFDIDNIKVFKTLTPDLIGRAQRGQEPLRPGTFAPCGGVSILNFYSCDFL
mgnify:FL=1